MNVATFPYLDCNIVISEGSNRGFVQLSAFPDADVSDDYLFQLRVRIKGEFSSGYQRIEMTKNAGIGIAKAKYLLRSYRHGSAFTVDLDNDFEEQDDYEITRSQATWMIGHALARLHGSGRVVNLDIKGIAHELGLDSSMVEAVVTDMAKSGTLEICSAGYGVKLTQRGAEVFDAISASKETALETTTKDIVSRLNTVRSGLGRKLSALMDTAAIARSSGEGLQQYGNQAREYFREITDVIYQASGFDRSRLNDTTERKISEIARNAGSQTKAFRIVALSKSLEKNARSFNEVTLDPTRSRLSQTHVLMAYVVLVLSELLDTATL